MPQVHDSQLPPKTLFESRFWGLKKVTQNIFWATLFLLLFWLVRLPITLSKFRIEFEVVRARPTLNPRGPVDAGGGERGHGLVRWLFFGQVLSGPVGNADMVELGGQARVRRVMGGRAIGPAKFYRSSWGDPSGLLTSTHPLLSCRSMCLLISHCFFFVFFVEKGPSTFVVCAISSTTVQEVNFQFRHFCWSWSVKNDQWRIQVYVKWHIWPKPIRKIVSFWWATSNIPTP